MTFRVGAKVFLKEKVFEWRQKEARAKRQKKKTLQNEVFSLTQAFARSVVQPEGFEPPTIRFVAEYSIQLSYGCINYNKDNITSLKFCQHKRTIFVFELHFCNHLSTIDF